MEIRMAEEQVPFSRNVQDEELIAAFEVPAVAINRFVITFARSGMRLAFGEQAIPGSVSKFRTAVIMSRGEALALRNLLSDMLDPSEAESKETDIVPESRDSGDE